MDHKKAPGKHEDKTELEDYNKKNLLENIITKHEKTHELQKIQHSNDSSRSGSSTNVNFRNRHPYSMNEQTLRARNEFVNRGRYITQLYLAVTVSMGAFCYGIVLGWTTPTVRLAMESETINGLDTYANIASLIPLGCCIGGLFFNLLCQQKGPKKTMLTIAPIQLIIWVLLMFFKGLTVSCALLFLSSFFSVGFIICGEVLLQDTVHSLNLQHLYLMFTTSTYAGITLTYVCGLMAHKLNYYYNYVSIILVGLMTIFLLFCHESPVFLYEKHPVKAQKSLRFYRGEGNIYEDLRQIKKDADARIIDTSAKYLLLKKVVYRAVFIVLALNFFQAFSGYFAFIAYGLYIFHTSNKDVTDIDVFGKIPDALIMGGMYYVIVLVSVFTHFKVPYGVKKPLIVSTFLVTLMLCLIGGYLYCYQRNYEFLLGNNWIRFVLQGFYIQAYHCGLGSYPDVIMMDYVPQQIYPWLKTVAFSFRWFWVYLMVRFTLITQVKISAAGAVCILGIASFLGFLFCCYYVIESKGKTLLQIQMKLGGNPIGYRSTMRSRTATAAGHS
ncbi:PREDICTED: facilitated trehalose transporter Tret1-like [Nicrophorus vespilloides]|uniref:Facilitated trehalose transporter Tret1-like n=1 Tax=Nicrophorus vespilloides TaxID=110193 RepID=A0ABM1MUH0_NICVS|nr:PREDICTED: facilitated trehalose transporter Tret1-like [Nicrophorus vespilloides]